MKIPRTFTIGDIHGGLKALEQVLDKADITPMDKLIFLGDYVDGWSDSANVISYLIELSRENPCVFIKGNHDDLLQGWLATKQKNNEWLQHGGQSTIEAYTTVSKETVKTHLHFLKNTKNYYIDSENRLFVHAGFTNMHGPQHEYQSYMLYWDRTLWEMALSLDNNLKKDSKYYPKRLQHFQEIYIGHTPTVRVGIKKPMQKANVWNIDTGAAFKGPLSMINVDTKEIFQSEPVFKLYPDELGRN